MKKLFLLALAMFVTVMLAACGASNQEPSQNEEDAIVVVNHHSHAAPLTIEELGVTIVMVGEFWEDWWRFRGIFSPVGDSVVIPTDEHGSVMSYSRFFPASEMDSLDDIKNHMLWFYTENALAQNHLPFREIDGVLHFEDARYGALRPNWDTATHTLIEQAGNRAVVETKVQGYDHRGSGDEMPTATLTITLIDGKIDNGLWSWVDFWGTDDAIIYEPFAASIGDTVLFINCAEHVVLESFDSLYAIDHSILWDGDIEQLVIWATQPIYNASLIHFSNDWDEVAGEDVFILIGTHGIANTLTPGKGLHILNYVSRGTFPWSGISFYDAEGERHFLAINHDNSDSPHWYMMLNITEQMRF
jgi:hypothetical protein